MMSDLLPISCAIVGAPTEMEMGIDELGSIALDSPSIGVSTLVSAGRIIGRSTFLLPITSDRSLIKVPFLTMGPGSPLKSASGDEFIYLSQIREGIWLFIKMIKSLNMLMNQDSGGMHSK